MQPIDRKPPPPPPCPDVIRYHVASNPKQPYGQLASSRIKRLETFYGFEEGLGRQFLCRIRIGNAISDIRVNCRQLRLTDALKRRHQVRRAIRPIVVGGQSQRLNHCASLVARNPISYLNNTLQAGEYYVARSVGAVERVEASSLGEKRRD